MRTLSISVLTIVLFSTGGKDCGNNNQAGNNAEIPNFNNSDSVSYKMKITVGPKTFNATLFNNPAATAFKALLPLTIDMIELNGNEKYFDLAKSLPNNSSNPGTIQSGDIMLYGSSTLVLFYTTFRTSYSYTKLGRIEDVSGLADALGTGDVTVRFELE